MMYFEVVFSKSGDADDCNAVWICIRGTERPSLEEAQRFLAQNSGSFGMPVVGVFPIDEQTARACYDFDNEANWPVFRKTHEEEDTCIV